MNGTTLTITFGAALDTSGSTPAGTTFTVAGTAVTTTVSTVAFKTGDATMVALTLSAAVGFGESGITVSYAKGMDANPLKGAGSGTPDVADFSSLAVSNETPRPASPVTLVSNTGQPARSVNFYNLGDDYAQDFTTGNETGGYTLTRVRIRMRSDATTPPVYSVHIEANASGLPAGSVRRLGTLTNPPMLSSTMKNHEFTAPAGGIDLDASTRYWVFLDAHSQGTGGVDRMQNTGSDAEDAGHASNWTVGNRFQSRDLRQTTWPFKPNPNSLQIAVHGHARNAEPAAFSSAKVDGTRLTITFGAALSSDSAYVPASDEFTVQVDGSGAPVSGVSILGSAVTLTLASAVTLAQTVTVAYAKPASGNKLVDRNGMEVASVTAQSVTNVTGLDTTAPTVSSVSISSNPAAGGAYMIGDAVLFTVAFSENVMVTGTPRIPFTLGSAAKHATFASGGGSANLVFSYTVVEGDADTDGIAVQAKALELNGGTIQDGASVPNAAELDHGAAPANRAHAVDGVRPVFSSATVAGTTLTLTFSERLAAAANLANGAFTVTRTRDGSPRSVTLTGKPSISGNTVRLTQSDATVGTDTDVMVRYEKPTAGTDNRIRDVPGNHADTFGDQAVNYTPPSSGGGGGGGGGAPRNQAPAATEDIGDEMLRAGAALEVDLSKHFSDADEDALDYAAESSDPAVALVSVDGAVLTVRGVGGGSAEIEVTATDPDGDSATQTFAVTVTAPEAVWYLPPASDPMRQGFVRVVNHSQVEGEATVTAMDDAGRRYEPLTLALKGGEAVHFNSNDLELGNAAKGLTGATGQGTGGWRLAVESETVDVEALGYVRTTDGFLTAMGDVAPLVDGAREVATFNPGSNVNQVSLLRLVNPADEDVEATVTGVDDAGRSPGDPVLLTVAAGASCTVDASQLESGSGLACGLPQAGLGDGDGKWRLAIESDVPLVAMSLLSSPTGHLTNLSGTNGPDDDGVWHVPLFPAAADALGRQGFVRVINRSDNGGQVTITASDDSDVDYEVLTLTLDAGAAVHFNSDDLELGNAAKGLTGSTGSGMGAWRLALAGDDAAGAPIAFEAHAYIRTADGFLTPMNGQAPERDGVHRIAFFNPGGNTNQVSTLRLINPGMNNRWVRIIGTDDSGVRWGTAVRVLTPATDAMELTAAELESGESVEPGLIDSGAIGDGSGKWRLHVEADPEVAVLSLLSSPTGHLTNLSRADAARGYEGGVAAPLSPPETVTLEDLGDRRVRGRWSPVEGARYGVDLLHDGVRDDDRSLTRASSTTFRWSSLLPGTYTIRACSVNEDRVCGPWSAESNEVVID